MSRSVSSKKRGKAKRSRRLVIAISGGVAVLMIATSAVAYGLMQPAKTPANGPISRQVLLAAEDHIKAVPPGPTLGALDYAYVASVYHDSLQASNQAQALAADKQMMEILFPTRRAIVDSQITEIAKSNHIKMPSALDSKVISIVSAYTSRYKNDGHTLTWDGTKPSGPEHWSSLIGAAPITPRAGDWQRWEINQPITVPAPPVFGSAEDNRQLNIVRQAVSKRNGEDINIINFWAGQPGSETPGGIWQNVMFDRIHGDISTNAVEADKQYAYIQSILARTVSDAFMECWKVKYTYWTARPDMRLPGISTAMDDPNFPGYVSGHATISKAAADVLSILVPRYGSEWEADAAQARYSRLVAGIHFDSDNAAGFTVGTAVGQQYANELHLQKSL
jgi:hypothetical protein